MKTAKNQMYWAECSFDMSAENWVLICNVILDFFVPVGIFNPQSINEYLKFKW